MEKTTIRHDGKAIELAEDAEPTSRVLPVTGYTEWMARGIQDGVRVRVYWIFDDDATRELDPDEYDWTNVDRVEVAG